MLYDILAKGITMSFKNFQILFNAFTNLINLLEMFRDCFYCKRSITRNIFQISLVFAFQRKVLKLGFEMQFCSI